MQRAKAGRTHKFMMLGMSVGMCLGIAAGLGCGVVLNNVSAGMIIGMTSGLLLGLVIGSSGDRTVDRQLRLKGYKIKSIEQSVGEGKYSVTLIGNDRIEVRTVVSEDQMMNNHFQIGENVCPEQVGRINGVYGSEISEKEQ
jgi:hypothetical protein